MALNLPDGVLQVAAPRDWGVALDFGQDESVEQTFILVCFEWLAEDILVVREPFEFARRDRNVPHG
ncbi:MAG TPA: hypothetical protein VFE47_00240 [Tepidisphaeraceae bacterium]|jgi:hypothetical protein|nr:hypothetical protein [Tepidisphaeraceae bacterium]